MFWNTARLGGVFKTCLYYVLYSPTDFQHANRNLESRRSIGKTCLITRQENICLSANAPQIN